MKTTLITGASSGIGEAFARKLAALNRNVLLVARSEDKLVTLCNELGRNNQIRAEYVVLDLADPKASQRLYEETEERGLIIDTLINNAGVGAMGEFTSLGLERQLAMIDLNARAVVELTYRFLGPMRERKQGTIVNVASTAGFQPVPYMSTYAATKAFVLAFSEALWEENRDHGVHVMALCPGVTDTNFFAAAQTDRPPMRVAELPEDVVETALRGLARGKSHVVSGWTNLFMIEAERLVPRDLVTRVTGRVMKSKYASEEQEEKGEPQP